MSAGTERTETGTGARTARRGGGRSRKGISGALAAGLLFLLLATPRAGPAQEMAGETDPGWLPWLGCWEVVDRPMEGPEEAAPSVLCVRPAEEGPGVQFLTVRDGGVSGREPVRADDRRRDSDREECSGWQRGAFSDDGHRVYLRSEHVCPGGVERTSMGLLAWISPSEWMEVRTVEVRGSSRTWVRRYRMAGAEDVTEAGLADLAGEPTMGVRSARMAAASPIRVDDLIEASSRLHPEAVGAWLAEQADPLDLDAEALVRMADAGVSERVVDVAVAVSYPDRFVVDRGGAVEEQESAGVRGRGHRRGYGPGYRPVRGFGFRGWYGGPYGYRPYRLHDPFYSPWGYSGFGYGYGYRPSIVYVVPRSDAGGSVVNGRGYTRSSSGGSERARPRPRPSPDRSSSPSPSAGRGGSSGGAVSPSGGYRGGSSDGDTGRTARPRGSDDGGGSGKSGSGSGSGSGSR